MKTADVVSGEPVLKSSVGKVLSLLRSFDRYPSGARLTELANDSGVAKSSTHRLLGALRTAGLVEREGMEWYLSSSMLVLGAGAVRGEATTLREVALPFMADLYEATRENVHLALMRGHEVVYLEKLYGHQSWPAPSRVGHRLPSHSCAVGKVMLAHSDPELVRAVLSAPLKRLTPNTLASPGHIARQLVDIRATGLSFDREEAREGLLCVAAPIRTTSGHVVAALSVAGRAGRFQPEQHAAAIQHAASQIGTRLGPSSGLLRDTGSPAA